MWKAALFSPIMAASKSLAWFGVGSPKIEWLCAVEEAAVVSSGRAEDVSEAIGSKGTTVRGFDSRRFEVSFFGEPSSVGFRT